MKKLLMTTATAIALIGGSVTTTIAADNGGIVVPKPNNSGFVGGVARNGNTTIVDHSKFRGGQSTSIQHTRRSGHGVSGRVTTYRGRVVGGGASVTFPIK